MKSSLRKVASFLEVKRGDKVGELSDDEIHQLEKHLSFGSMSKNPATNNEMLESGAIASTRANDIKFMRKGIVSICHFRVGIPEKEVQTCRTLFELQ